MSASRACVRDLLILQNGARGAGVAGEEQQQIVFQLENRLSRHAQRLDGDAVILVEGEADEAAKCRDELILLADRVSQALDFDVASVFGQFLGMGGFSLVRVERFQQRGGETAGRPKTRSGGNIGERGDLYLRRFRMVLGAALPE